MDKKILIRADANAQIGWGHFYRCLSLAQMLEKHFSVSFAMASPPTKARELLAAKGFELIGLPYQPYSLPDEKGDNELDFDLAQHLQSVDLVLLDGYWFGTEYQKSLRRYKVKVGMVEDAGEGTYLTDLIINHVPGLQKSDYITDNPSTRYALGSDYALLRPSFLQAARAGKKAATNKQVLICFGGSDQHDYTGKAYTAVSTSDQELSFLIIFGPSYAHRARLETMIGGHPGVSLQSSLDEAEMVQAMANSEVAIVPSSGILYECLAVGNNVVTVQCAENQKHFHAAFTQLPQVYSAGEFTPPEIREAFEKALTYDGPRSRVVDGESGERLSQLIRDLLKE